MQRLLTKGIGHSKFKKTELGEIPEEWELNKISKISEFIMFERKCCPFFMFELLFALNTGPVYLHMRGSKDVKEFIKKELLQLKSS